MNVQNKKTSLETDVRVIAEDAALEAEQNNASEAKQ
jgi:hypothetical protein